MKFSRAFTIVELIIYMGLISILLGVFTSIFLSALDAQLSSQAASRADQDNRYLLARLSHDVQRASQVISPEIGQTDTSLTLLIDGQQHFFTLSGGRLQRQVEDQVDFLTGIGTSVSQFSITTVEDGSVQLKVTVVGTGTSTQAPEIRSFQTAVGVR